MRAIILTSLITVSLGTVNAAVYKCESDFGVNYQDSPCIGYKNSKKMTMTPIDPKIVKQAQAKLEKELKQRQVLEQQRAEAERKERILRALELKASAAQNLAYETRMQTYAIDDNTRALDRLTLYRNQDRGGVVFKSY